MGCSRAIEPAEAEETSVYWKMVANYEEEVDIVAELWPRRILISSDQVAVERALAAAACGKKKIRADTFWRL